MKRTIILITTFLVITGAQAQSFQNQQNTNTSTYRGKTGGEWLVRSANMQLGGLACASIGTSIMLIDISSRKANNPHRDQPAISEGQIVGYIFLATSGFLNIGSIFAKRNAGKAFINDSNRIQLSDTGIGIKIALN